MVKFKPFSGIVTKISSFFTGDAELEGCMKLMEVKNRNGEIVNFVISPATYFVNSVVVEVGDGVTGFYDTNAATPLIYPPQFRAIVMAKNSRNYNVKVDYFNELLESSDGTLRLNIARSTKLTMVNAQNITGRITDRNLIVLYGPTTRSIPAQTTPYKIIVLCNM
ncbi:MAG TPA: hypothetical protein GX710_04310 [Clostridiales bacterium]|nr:hypothetical protein [Clostridiales bacterium]